MTGTCPLSRAAARQPVGAAGGEGARAAAGGSLQKSCRPAAWRLIPTGKPTEPTEKPTEVHDVVSCTFFLSLPLHLHLRCKRDL